MRLNLRTVLSVPSLERCLRAERPYQVRAGWSRRLSEEGLTVDFSQLRWAEPSALVMIVLLIEACAREGFDIQLRLPRREPSAEEAEILEKAQRGGSRELVEKAGHVVRGIEGRRKVLRILELWRLLPALRAEHIVQQKGIISVEEEFDWSLGDASGRQTHWALGGESSGAALGRVPEGGPSHKLIFPLHWISSPADELDTSELEKIVNDGMVDFLSSVLSVQDRGISVPDARNLARVFLFELAENVLVHAGVSHGLLAVWARPSSKVSPEQCDSVAKRMPRPSELDFGRWALGFPVVEVIVGDSGCGIPAALSAEFGRWSAEVATKAGHPVKPADLLGFDAPGVGSLTTNQEVMFWSLDKWSSSRLRSHQRGTRGLYRVLRVVRKWEGELTIRAETHLVGLDCRVGVPEPVFVESKRLARAPGTVVHLRLPSKPLVVQPPRVVPKPARQSHFTIVDFDSTLDTPSAIEKAVKMVAEESQSHPSLSQPLVTIVELGFHRLDRHELEDLLLGLVQVAGTAGVVLANVGGTGWDSLVEIAHSIEESVKPADAGGIGEGPYDPTAIQDAVMVLDRSGRVKWVGHQGWLCSVLDRMMDQGELRWDDILQALPEDLRDEQSLRDLLEQWHVIEASSGDAFHLRFNLGDIVEQLHRRTAKYLSELIRDSGPPAVHRQHIYITASQRCVHSYIGVNDLLGEQGRRRVLGSLAMQVRLEIARKTPARAAVSVVTDEGEARGLANSFREKLGQADLCPVPTHSRVGRLRGSMAIPAGTPVVLFTDLISTGSLVKALLARIADAGLEPCCVACIIDAREEAQDQISVEGGQVPVVSALRLDLVPNQAMLANRPEARINPVSNMPEATAPPLRYEIDPRRLDDMVAVSDAMLFGHIEWSPWRHFTIYLDALRLLESEELVAEVHAAFGRVVDRWMEENRLHGVDKILYPATAAESGGHGSAAETIAEAVRDRYHLGPEQVELIPRKQGATGFIFDPVTDLTGDSGRGAGENIVLLDWGCVTGQTARRMIRKAAERRARHALLVFFVSQLPSWEERNLRVLTRAAWIDGIGETKISVQFISQCATWGYSQNECPYCERLRRLDDDMQTLDPPVFLQDFVRETREDFAARTLSEMRFSQDGLPGRMAARGALQLPLTSPSESFVRMARFRELMIDAEASNAERERVRTHILQLAQIPDGCQVPDYISGLELIMLVDREWTLLSRPPLSEHEIRTALAEIARGVVEDEARAVEVRRSAINVLRGAAPEQFTGLLPALTLKVLHEPRLIMELLYSAFTLLRTAAVSSTTRLPKISLSLGRASSAIRDAVQRPTGESHVLRVLQAVSEMHGAALYEWMVLPGGDVQPSDAWRQLRLTFGSQYGMHDERCKACAYLFLVALEDALRSDAGSLPSVQWSLLLKAWEERAEPFLLEELLPLLRPLRSLLAGRYVARRVGLARSRLLAERNHAGIRRRMNTLTTCLLTFASDPECVRDPGLWEDFTTARNDIWDLLLSPGGGHAEPSVLLSLLRDYSFDAQDVPAVVARVCDSLASRVGRQLFDVDLSAASQTEQCLLFCHEEVIEQCFDELFGNIVKHRESVANGRRIPVRMVIRKLNNRVEMTIMNQCTASANVSGRQGGLAICRELLSAYGAQLVIESAVSPWTFAVTMRFEEV